MTDTTTVDEEQSNEDPSADSAVGDDTPVADDTGGGGVDEHIAISSGVGEGPHVPVKDRLLIPLLLPILCAVAVGMLAINISRVFLAGDSTAALISAIVITLSILGGASLLAASPRLRTSSLAMITGLIVVIVVSAGLLTLGPSLGHEEGEVTGYVEPTGPAVGTLAVVAGPGLTFDGVANGTFTAPAGIVEVEYGGENGHTLAFREPEFAGFLLGPTPNPPLSGKVELNTGEYEIYCTIPGHAAAGMQATVTVSG